jgi:hypothetical protein
LGSAYFLGANVNQLLEMYEDESRNLEPWQDSPSEISRDDWRDYLGKREYETYLLHVQSTVADAMAAGTNGPG